MYDKSLEEWQLMLLDPKSSEYVPTAPASFPSLPRVLVPYDRDGNFSERERMWLDLRAGQRVKLTDGHNIQGAKQPQYVHHQG